MMAGSSTDKRPPSDSPEARHPARRRKVAANKREASRKRPTPVGGDPSTEKSPKLAHPQAKYVRTELHGHYKNLPAKIQSRTIKEEKMSDEEHPTDAKRCCQQEAIAYSSFESNQNETLRTTNSLPPGWVISKDNNTQLWYYQDVETHYSTWVPPAPYTPTDWTRVERDQQSAYWVSEKLRMQFDEYGQTDWQRIIFYKKQRRELV